MKRTVSALLCLLLAFSVAVLPMPARAAGAPVVFTSINDIFTRNLTTATMPARINGVMYISYLYLLRLEDLTYVKTEDTVTVMGNGKGLIYDARSGQVSDLSGQLRPMTGAVRRNGGIYLPVEELCAYFGYSCSIISSSGLGEIIRISSQPPSVADSLVLSANIEVLRQIYVDYQLTVAKEQQEQPAEPEVPDPTDPVEPEPQPTPVRWIYLYFELTPDAVTDVPQLLEQKGLTATFFVRPRHIVECADYLRRLLNGGHTLALLVEGDDPAAQLEEGNRLLYTVCLKKTRLAHVTGGTADQRQALTEDGWKLWSWTEDSGYDSQTVAASVISTMARLDAVETEAVLRLGSNDAGYQTLNPILYYAESNNYRYRTIRLWTEPLV